MSRRRKKMRGLRGGIAKSFLGTTWYKRSERINWIVFY